MVKGFSAIIVHVPDLEAAAAEYGALLGGFPAAPQSGETSLPLANVAIRLVLSPDVDTPQLGGLALWCEEPVEFPPDMRTLPLSQDRERRLSASATATGITAVDHLVLRTSDADDCIRLFGDDLGMRLALDQSVPEWGGRMLFFRCGKLTLEVIQGEETPAQDYLWGITYLCEDLATTLEALDAAGVAHSGDRLGRKPGTRVATVKSHTLGIPTLLIGPGR